jgi:hypothetical protein
VHESTRLQDLAIVESRVRENLPAGVLTQRDLRDAALERLAHAPAVLGPVELDRVVRVAPVWRPLLAAVARVVPLRWRNPGAADVGWFAGAVETDDRTTPAAPDVVSCAAPRAEVVEALRWVRELIASGRARPEEIAVCTTATEDWDEHMLVLATDAGLPVHFSHGVPALASREGQACAALADILLNGLSQDRVRRLFGHAAGGARALQELPRTWAEGLQPGAALFELDQWRHALDAAHARRQDGVDVRAIVGPVLEVLARGPEVAAEVGDLLLGGAARALWVEALRRAPPQALAFSLQELHLPDGRDPGACVVWCPASHLAAAPRPFVRLLGLTTRSWPRSASEDPLMPSHILPREALDAESITDQDRRAFELVCAHSTGGLVLSRSRLNALGGLQAASPLVPAGREHQLPEARPHSEPRVQRGRPPAREASGGGKLSSGARR